MNRMRQRWLGVGMAAVLLTAGMAQAVEYTWNGGTGLWNSSNWSPGNVAGPTSAADSAIINSGTVQLSGHDVFGNSGAATATTAITVGIGAILDTNGMTNPIVGLTLTAAPLPHAPQDAPVVIGGTASTPSRSPTGAGVTAPSRPARKRPAHHAVVEVQHQAIIVFITVCTQHRQAVLANHHMHALLQAAWCMSNHWNVGRYVIMPDHVHFFCAPGVWPPPSLKKWVAYWKTLVSQAVIGQGPLAKVCAPSVPPSGAGVTAPSRLWPRDFWDMPLRHGDSYTEKWAYVRRNPVRADLCNDPDLWPFQGQCTLLKWHG